MVEQMEMRGENAFDFACSKGHLKVIKFLLSLTGDDRIDQETCQLGFDCACSNQQFEIIKVLLNSRDERKLDDKKNKFKR